MAEMWNWIHVTGFIVFMLSYTHARSLGLFNAGGWEVNPVGKWPFMASLQFRDISMDWTPECGGVLLTSQHVLTAAHCVNQGYDISRYRVVLGAHDIKTLQQGQPEIYNIEATCTHPEFQFHSDLGYPNDVAVLKLTESVNINNNFIDVVRMSDEKDPDYIGQDCVRMGWGVHTGQYVNSKYIESLHEADINVISNALCREIFGEDGEGWVGPYHICVYDVENKLSGSCYGDSGGPLVCQREEDGEWELAGTTSWGYSSCSTTYPAVYARTSLFRVWLDRVLEDMSAELCGETGWIET